MAAYFWPNHCSANAMSTVYRLYRPGLEDRWKAMAVRMTRRQQRHSSTLIGGNWSGLCWVVGTDRRIRWSVESCVQDTRPTAETTRDRDTCEGLQSHAQQRSVQMKSKCIPIQYRIPLSLQFVENKISGLSSCLH